jgi:hypothetical protein
LHKSYASQAVEIQTRIVAEFHRDYRRTIHREGQVPAPVATAAAGTGKSDRPEAYLIRMLQYEAMHLPSSPPFHSDDLSRPPHSDDRCAAAAKSEMGETNTSISAMESDPGAAGSLSDLLDSALGLLDPEE